ncbi:TonB-dependent siderophore receptor [Microbulbifer sp. OS29]|uniref:TonB-dependent siderophore receptor n=1 Tax=Microbulbifer okhotskensis TaxID=2926617 RepID=A0A9X2J462_9GAMM|nr:TonB-dependent siderophore receptor [Microbulbifer okhotskensis]MCO1334212.1 TonB-dependent siderophore receptor [Microbulbifer okhotskensis]
MYSKQLNLAVWVSLTPAALVSAQEVTQTVEEVEVIGRAQQFYLDPYTQIGTKTDTDLLNIAMSAQVLSEQLIEDQAARDITDLYRSIAGVSEFSYSGVTFRGFRDNKNVFYDGVRGDPYSGFSVPQVSNVARIEVLKGPSAALYGGGEPGGMINFTSKKPTFHQNRELTVTSGSESLKGASIELAGSVTGNTAYRLGGFYESQDSFRNNADSENTKLAGGLLFNLSADTQLTTTFEHIEQNLGGNRLRGVPVDDDGRFLVAPSYNANEKSDYQDLKALVLLTKVKHKLTESLNLNATVRYMENEREQAYHEPRGWVDINEDGTANAEDETIRREYRDQYRANEELSLTLDFVYDIEISDMNHQILFGGDYHDVDTKYDYWRARHEADGVANLNIYEHNYGITDPSTYNLTDMNKDGTASTRISAYVQDTVALNNQWFWMLGARIDQFNETEKGSGNSYIDDDASYRTGITYKPVETLSFYVNYSQSFNPVSADDFEDGAEELEPSTGSQVEIGVKKKWLDGRILTTLGFYQIEKTNMAQNNPDYISAEETPNEAEIINLGLVQSEGSELTLVGDITEKLSITANYAFNDTYISEGGSRNVSDSSKFVNAPKHQAGLWARYDLSIWDSAFSVGADYVSDQISFDDQKVKAYTVFDVSWTTRWDDIQLSINVNNLLNKTYAVSGFNERHGHFPGQPRELIAQLAYNF